MFTKNEFAEASGVLFQLQNQINTFIQSNTPQKYLTDEEFSTIKEHIKKETEQCINEKAEEIKQLEEEYTKILIQKINDIDVTNLEQAKKELRKLKLRSYRFSEDAQSKIKKAIENKKQKIEEVHTEILINKINAIDVTNLKEAKEQLVELKLQSYCCLSKNAQSQIKKAIKNKKIEIKKLEQQKLYKKLKISLITLTIIVLVLIFSIRKKKNNKTINKKKNNKIKL